MRRAVASWVRARWKLVLTVVIPVVLWAALHPVLAALSQRHGFGSPDGLGKAYLVVAVLSVALRVLLLTVVPAIIGYRAVAWTVTRAPRRPRSSPPPTPDTAGVRVEHTR